MTVSLSAAVRLASLSAGLLVACAGVGAFAQQPGFKFSQSNDQEQAAREAKAQEIGARLSTPCRAQLKDKKIMVIIGEQSSAGGISANQQNYGPHFQAINGRLRALGLKTYTPEEIRRQIAQAEIDAYFKGNPDAAISASKRLGASFTLRGLISAQAGRNAVIPVNEVIVSMGFTLADAGGRPISDASAQGGSFAGADTRSAAASLVSEQADEVVSKLYADYCTRAGLTESGRKK
jgi:hypothetical protein